MEQEEEEEDEDAAAANDAPIQRLSDLPNLRRIRRWCSETTPSLTSTAFLSVKAWLYNHLGPRAEYDAPGHLSTRMAYGADGTRLFSCGTNKEGNSYLIEWNEGEGSVKHTYKGFGKRFVGVVQFGTTKNRYLAAGDEFMVKFWDTGNINLLITIDAEGGLPASPCIRFNKDGFLLVISTNDNGVKILATSSMV